MENVLITGVAGFIGYYTCQQLLKRGCRVTGIDNLNDYYDPALKLKRLEISGISPKDALSEKMVTSTINPSYRFIRADIADANKLNKLFEDEKFDLVINLAAQPGARYSVENPESYLHSNITGFLNILEACRHHPPGHLVYASSSSVYGNNVQTPYAENHMTDSPASLYGASKKSNELMAYAYSHLYGIPMTGLRFFTVYGPWGRPDMVYFKYTNAILSNQPIDVYNHGKLKRDYTYVDDIVKGIMDLIPIIPDGAVPHQVFNIGNSEPIELLHFIETLEKILGKKAIKNMMDMQQGDVLITYADTAKLENYCGYKPYTSIEAGLRKFTAWYFEEYLKL
jgi:UDP-glucuronate 4-epimerase